MTTAPTILAVHELGFAYRGEPPLFERWSIAIMAGVTLVLGDTGSGKSTLLRLLSGAERGSEPITGRLTLAGIGLDVDAAAYRRSVFRVDPSDAADDQRVAREVIGEPGLRHADGFALEPHLDKPLYMLSTGSRRKVWLAAALASPCALVLLDEPMGGLDAPSRAYLLRALATCGTARAIVVASSEGLGGVPLAATITLPVQGA